MGRTMIDNLRPTRREENHALYNPWTEWMARKWRLDFPETWDRTKYDWSNKKVCFLSACKCRCYVVDWGISNFELARANEMKKNHFGSSDGMSRFLLWKVRTLNARDWVTWQSGQSGTQTFSLWLKITTFLLCFWVFCPWFTAIGSFILWMLSKDSLSLVFSNVYVMCLRVLHLTSPINSPMNIPY